MTTWSLPTLLVLACVLGSGCATDPLPPPPPAPWLTVSTGTPDSWRETILDDAGRLAHALEPLTGPIPRGSTWTIHLTDSPQEFPPELAKGLPGEAVTDALRHESWIARAPSDAETRRLIRHELVHACAALALGPLDRRPPWLREGLACLYEMGIARDGVPAANRTRRRQLQAILRGTPGLPLHEVLDLPRDNGLSSGGYAAAWGLTYALYHNKLSPDGRECLRQCLHAPSPDAANALLRAHQGSNDAARAAWRARWRKAMLRLGGPFG